MSLRTRLSSLGRRTGGRQSITYHSQHFEMQIDNNRSNGIRLRLRLDQALQPGKAQRDKVKNQYLPRMATRGFCGGVKGDFDDSVSGQIIFHVKKLIFEEVGLVNSLDS